MKYAHLFLLSLLSFGCNSDACDNLSYNLLRLQKVNTLYAKVDWNLDTLQAFGDLGYLYRLSSLKGDTLWYTQFVCLDKEDTTEIWNFNVQYFEDRYVHNIEFRKDTIYHYKLDTITYEKIFISGKYTYQYINMELSPGHWAFYHSYKDSLDHVKGDSLPPIPELLQENKDTIPNPEPEYL